MDLEILGEFMPLPLTVMIEKVMLESCENSQLLAKLMGADEDDRTI